jgi:hypothetical protein
MIMKRLRFGLAMLLAGVMSPAILAAEFTRIIIPEPHHPALQSAARLIARKLDLPDSAIIATNSPEIPAKGEIIFTAGLVTAAQTRLLGEMPAQIKHDGYAVVNQDGGALIYGVRPRSFLFAAGDVHLWKNRPAGTFVRDPAFANRMGSYHGNRPMAEFVAALGINGVVSAQAGPATLERSIPELFNRLSPEDQSRLERQSLTSAERLTRLARDCRDADVSFFLFLYGNDFARWSPSLYEAAIRLYPSAQGKPAPTSWEKASLCPSDPMTWKILEAWVKERADRVPSDGLAVTFWDHYGLYCQCERCVKNGLNQFPNQVYECVKHYHQTLAPLGRKLIVRTWSSGVPHWLGEEWVHAPGYDDFGGSGEGLWGRVIRELPADIVLQTKVYHSDCQPDARFSPLLGKTAPHPEIAEYQITGQTTGRFYFPASTVDHTAWTLRESRRLLGPDGGVSLHPGGTAQSDYDLLKDIANSINVYAWRELSWDVGKDVDAIWMEWAVPLFGEKAARHVVNALRLSEKAVNRLFSSLGLGTDTNSGFPEGVRWRETLLKYTNRYYLPEYARFLEPTRENIQRVMDEKKDCLKLIDEMRNELELARPNLAKEQYDELTTRLGWLREFAIVVSALDESLWRYRYLRHQASMLTTDPGQMKYLAAALDTVTEHQKRLFQFDANQRFSCYSVPLGRLQRRPSLGNPLPLMRELYDRSKALVEESVGPDYLPQDWRR